MCIPISIDHCFNECKSPEINAMGKIVYLFTFRRFIIIMFTADHIGRFITSTRVRVEDEANATASLTGLDSVQTDIVAPTV